MASTPVSAPLMSFYAANGKWQYGRFLADAAGDLDGATLAGGANGDGAVGEIAYPGEAYASAPTSLLGFNSYEAQDPIAGLISASATGAFSATATVGANGSGTVNETAIATAAFSSTMPVLTTLVSFGGAFGSGPFAGLIADAAGDLFGTEPGNGANDRGAVFEIAKTSTGYASTPTTLVSFNGADGQGPEASLITDAAGDLFGTTAGDGLNNDGTVFEIAKTSTGYASALTTLVSFYGANGFGPSAGLTTDAAGDLFSTTLSGGKNNLGTVFEIAKTSTGYASTPTILVNFNGANGQYPAVGLIADAAGDLFGTTNGGGANNGGTIFEIVKTNTGYASTPTTLVSFNGADGNSPQGELLADSTGDLFGTTAGGGANNDGTVFEIAKTSKGYTKAC